MDRAAFSMAAANVLHSKSTHWRHLKIGEFGMKTLRKIILPFALLLLSGSAIFGADNSAPTEKTFDAPNDLKVSVKMIGPYSEPADLQIICLFQHKSSGDTYQGAAKDTDEHLNGLLSALRNRGEFVGELGETILFTPANGSIPAKRFMVIGLGKEKDLSLDALHLVGRVAAREAVRLQAKHVAWAPVVRDQGNTTLDVGQGDRAFIEQMLSAYDTEKRLQAQKLAPLFNIETVVIEAGPAYFEGAAKLVSEGIKSMATEIAKRSGAPYTPTKTE
jgi:Cytosol aminopeptidase family, N-terminal domain